jgi:hypothetical protein
MGQLFGMIQIFFHVIIITVIEHYTTTCIIILFIYNVIIKFAPIFVAVMSHLDNVIMTNITSILTDTMHVNQDVLDL